MFNRRIAMFVPLVMMALMATPAIAQSGGMPQASPLGSGVAAPPSTPNYNGNGNGTTEQSTKKHIHHHRSNPAGGGTSTGNTGSQGA